MASKEEAANNRERALELTLMGMKQYEIAAALKVSQRSVVRYIARKRDEVMEATKTRTPLEIISQVEH